MVQSNKTKVCGLITYPRKQATLWERNSRPSKSSRFFPHQSWFCINDIIYCNMQTYPPYDPWELDYTGALFCNQRRCNVYRSTSIGKSIHFKLLDLISMEYWIKGLQLINWKHLHRHDHCFFDRPYGSLLSVNITIYVRPITISLSSILIFIIYISLMSYANKVPQKCTS